LIELDSSDDMSLDESNNQA